MSSTRSRQSGPRRDVILAKLLEHVAVELRRKGADVTSEVLNDARRQLESRWEAAGTLGANDVAVVVSQMRSSAHRANSSLAAPIEKQHQQNSSDHQNFAPATKKDDAVSGSAVTPQPASASQLLMTTSKRQRRILADDEWANAAEQDRRNAAEGRRADRVSHLNHLAEQRRLLDAQLEEHRREQEAERLRRKQQQDEMTNLIESNREAARREAQEAHDRATKEKEFRQKQQRELDEAKEQQRIAEHNEQVRQSLLAQQELQRLRDLENQRKLEEQREWKRILTANEERMEDKKRQKEAERAEGRRYMQMYADDLDRQDRERAEARARKAARAAVFSRLAEGVASMYQAKVEDLDSRIEAEYQQQLAATLADEAARKERNRRREKETHETLRRQMELKKQEEEREREDARKRAQAMREQEEFAKRQDELRRQAQKAEAARLNEFLGTQLQLLHFKETKPLETSITRPLSRAKTMFSPTRYRSSSASPALPSPAKQ